MRSLIEWMAKNTVAANILLVCIGIGGVFAIYSTPQEIFPVTEFDIVTISVAYPGAGPSEIEETICLPIEKAVDSVNNVEQITCDAREENAQITVTLEDNVDLTRKLQEIKNAIDQIYDLPKESLLPVVKEIIRRRQVLTVVLYGKISEETLFRNGDQIKDDFLNIEGVNFVELTGQREREILIEVTPENLSRFNLSLEKLSQIISNSSRDFPGGSIKTGSSRILLRTSSKRDNVRELSQIVVLTRKDGTTVRLNRIGTIKEQLEEASSLSRFNGLPALRYKIFQNEKLTPKQISKKVRSYMEHQNASLPEGLSLAIWTDNSELFESRFNLLIKNAWVGLLLVFIVMALFLEIRLSFWVMLGIPVSILGSLTFLNPAGVTINMISMFGFILVLGIIVDDAIVIGENIYQHRERGATPIDAAIEGCMEMAGPVTVAILTTMIAFAPLLVIQGMMGKFLYAIPIIVIAVLGISLVEGLLVLPAHLSKLSVKPLQGIFKPVEKLRLTLDRGLKWVTVNYFGRILRFCLINRYLTNAFGIASLILCFGLIAGGIVPVKFFPSIPSDIVRISVELPPGYPASKASPMIKKIEDIGLSLLREIDLKADNGIETLEHIYTTIQSQSRHSPSKSTSAMIQMKLKVEGKRNISAVKFGEIWKKQIHQFPEIRSISVVSRRRSFGNDIQISLSHRDTKLLVTLTKELKTRLNQYEGIKNISDSEKEGSREFSFRVSNEGRSLGITPSDFGRNLRAAFQGHKAFTLKRNNKEIKVIVLYPKAYRENLNALEATQIMAPGGGKITMGDAAVIEEGVEPVAIHRVDRNRVVDITASVDKTVQSPNEIVLALQEDYLKDLQVHYPGLTITMEGSSKERSKSLNSLWLGFIIALFAIYALLAVFFRSYTQPFIVMSAIPFGMAGAVLGHYALGHPLSFLSLFGFIGLTGVVVNDSLILIDAINRHPEKRKDRILALVEASQSRLRPIILTSVTTFAGLMPILLETSRQAQYLIPMAISLGVGIMFATFITLVLVPAIYLVMIDIRSVWSWHAIQKAVVVALVALFVVLASCAQKEEQILPTANKRETQKIVVKPPPPSISIKKIKSSYYLITHQTKNPEMLKEMIGTWQVSNSSSLFKIEGKGNRLRITGKDTQDGETFKVQHLSWDGEVLSGTYTMPSTNHTVESRLSLLELDTMECIYSGDSKGKTLWFRKLW